MSADAYKLRLDRPLDREVARLFRSQVNRARRALKKPDDDSVHTARKALKRARAVLRLVRGALAQDDFDRLDDAVRQLGRRLGPVRDAAVADSLVDGLAEEKALKPSVIRALRAELDARHAAAWIDLTADDGIEAIRTELADLRLDRDALAGIDALALHGGFAWTYRRGGERLSRAVERRRAHDLHAWRRQVKHLGYQLRVLTPIWPLVLGPTARAFDRLAEALGDDHDLDELARIAAASGLGKNEARAVARLARKRREALQSAIWPLGARCYAESPGAFAGRVTLYLAAALAEAHGAPIHPLDGVALPSPPNRLFAPVPTAA
ncbi:MAG: CHAD domain-containing protein [Rhodothermaceae bacterium]|nr:CHAD domain-containing protein [Rhodothermaceae bacterium]